MVLCPPHPAQTPSPGRDPDLDSGPAGPFPDLDLEPAGPFPDLEPDEDEFAPPPSPVTRAAAARSAVMPGLIRPRRKPKRTLAVTAAALTLPLALGVGVPRSWWSDGPNGRSLLHFTHSPSGGIESPRNVIVQARARQRRRRQHIIRDTAIGSGAALAARSATSGPHSRSRVRTQRHNRRGHHAPTGPTGLNGTNVFGWGCPTGNPAGGAVASDGTHVWVACDAAVLEFDASTGA